MPPNPQRPIHSYNDAQDPESSPMTNMTPEQLWSRIQALCEEAEKQPPPDRAAFLERVESNPAIRDEVHAMLTALAQEAQAVAEYQPPPFQLASPASIGPYTILGFLGRGGNGAVYAAEIDRAGVKQPVAVKVLHSHLADGETEARFHREQQMLAHLDHPGIIRVLDVGVTPDQQPYLVMDRVLDGLPIDAYCDREKLDIAARLRLMIQACDAVAAAHRSLIVHLDLKPSNLLIDRDGRARLLDFGTAKLVRPGDFTSTRQMTPLYASPEQLRGESVTTACDVYSLGVVLYELVTGEWPFGNRDSMFGVWSRAYRETASRRLTERLTPEAAAARGMRVEQLRSTLQGDLEAIVQKAIAAQPAERYPTVAALAEDLERFLDQRPVLARKQTAWYQVRKYAVRNRGTVASTLVLLLGLTGALGYAWWQQREKLAAARVAQETAEFLNWMIQSSRPMYGGRQDMPVRELVQNAGQELKRRPHMSDSAAGNLLQALGGYLAEAGDPDGAMVMMAEAGRRAATPGERITARMAVSSMLIGRGKCEDAMKIVREVEADVERYRASMPPITFVTYLTQRSEAMDTCEARKKDMLQLLAPLPAIVRQVPDNATNLSMRPGLLKALAMNTYAVALYSAQRYEEALQVIEEGMRYAGTGPDTPGVRIALYRTIGSIEQGRGRIKAAADALGECVRLSEGFTSTFENLRLKVMWATKLGLTGETERPAKIAREVIAETHRRADEIGPIRWMILSDAALALMRCGQCEEVPALVKEVDAIAGKSMGAAWRGNRLSTEGFCLIKLGKVEEGKRLIRETLQVMAPIFTPDSKFKKELEAALR